jgi:adenosylcobinamide kinase/adenosylcobinamide-phosphate guanylyltransferase
MAEIILITGGAKSGKSTFALTLSEQHNYDSRHFLATALPFDEEMEVCIKKHREERGSEYKTCEEPYELAVALGHHLTPNHQFIIIDCLTVWLGNLFYKYAEQEKKIEQAISAFLYTIEEYKQKAGGTLVVITNELGWGIIPADKISRLYRMKAGQLNQKLALLVHKVFLCVAGIPLLIKGQEKNGGISNA